MHIPLLTENSLKRRLWRSCLHRPASGAECSRLLLRIPTQPGWLSRRSTGILVVFSRSRSCLWHQRGRAGDPVQRVNTLLDNLVSNSLTRSPRTPRAACYAITKHLTALLQELDLYEFLPAADIVYAPSPPDTDLIRTFEPGSAASTSSGRVGALANKVLSRLGIKKRQRLPRVEVSRI